jgi:LysR family transcriptional regulator of abg operon
MRFDQLAHYLSVLECGSIREAARRAGLTQPALSKSLRMLEADLQVQLLNRSHNGISATSQGLIFATRARAMHAELRKAREELALEYRPGEASVAFGVGQASMTLVMVEAIQIFRARWPRARISIAEGLSDTLVPRVRDGTLDFVLGGRIGNLSDNMTFKPLFRSSRAVVGRKRHRLIKAQSLSDLKGAEWISIPPLEAVSGPLDQIFSAAGLPVPTATIRCESYHSATFLLANTDMLALMSRRQLATPYGSMYLRAIPVREIIPGFTVGMYTRRDVSLTPAGAALASAVAAVAKRVASSEEG